MASLFPDMRPLTLTDRTLLERYTAEHPPYSDFHFTSLWSWNTKDQFQIGIHNGTIILRLTDYITGEFFYTFLGTENIVDTVKTILDEAKRQGYAEELRLVPEVVVRALAPSDDWEVEEDESSHDYVLSVERLCRMSGNRLRGKKNFIHRFHREFGDRHRVWEFSLTNEDIQRQLLGLFDHWAAQPGKMKVETQAERNALVRLLAFAHAHKLLCVGVAIDNSLVAFSINELAHDGYAIMHFEKADFGHVGIFPFLKQQTALLLQSHGAIHLNLEQDLGIEGLRKAKISYQPTHFLKKYIIRKKPSLL